MMAARLTLPLEGRVVAKRPGGVAADKLGPLLLRTQSRAAFATPSGRCAAISPSRGEKAPRP
jgi:hypothetical protein